MVTNVRVGWLFTGIVSAFALACGQGILGDDAELDPQSNNAALGQGNAAGGRGGGDGAGKGPLHPIHHPVPVPVPPPDFSQPLGGLTATQLADFNAGKTAFETEETPAEGLGPIFNNTSCAKCHGVGGAGGGSELVEIRAGKVTGGVFDPLANEGGSIFQLAGIGVFGSCNFVAETIPADANVQAKRRATPIFGLGLVDAVPDSTFIDLAAREPAATRGRVNMVNNISAGTTTVGKFGWKSQVPTLFQFSGDAYNNEMGVTNPQFPNESCPNGDCSLIDKCNPLPTLNDQGDDVEAFANFMSFLAAPPRGAMTEDVKEGEEVFNRVGCQSCHLSTLTSGANAVAALSKKTFHPYSDFLIHDMGSLGDDIGGMGEAGLREMRTAPLWGLRVITTFLHDGRANTLSGAILAHDGQGAAARDAFKKLRAGDQAKLLAFLKSL